MGVVDTGIVEQRIQGNTYGVYCGFCSTPSQSGWGLLLGCPNGHKNLTVKIAICYEKRPFADIRVC